MPVFGFNDQYKKETPAKKIKCSDANMIDKQHVVHLTMFFYHSEDTVILFCFIICFSFLVIF